MSDNWNIGLKNWILEFLWGIKKGKWEYFFVFLELRGLIGWKFFKFRVILFFLNFWMVFYEGEFMLCGFGCIGNECFDYKFFGFFFFYSI